MAIPTSNRDVSARTAGLLNVLTRRKTDEEDLDPGTGGGNKLNRVLGLGDLTMLGVGSTLGLGVYVLAGSVAKTDAGPAVTLSFLIAAIASAFAGMCYAEFAARVPKAGSAYVYCYVTVGELAAFIIGWNLILEYVIGTASVARGLSNYIDSMFNHTMSSALTEAMPINVSWLSPYPDFLSCGFILLLSLLLAWGVKESSLLNNVFTSVNLLTVITVIVVGVFYINFKNWALDPNAIPAKDSSGHTIKGGSGGFMPFGVSGVMAGAAKCFYGFVGFDCVATTGEEAKNPKRDIPLSIVISLFIIFFAYFGIASVLTLMLPYYEQDKDAPLPYVFEAVGVHLIKNIVTFGAIFALFTSLLGAIFPLPRVLYAMSHDGILFEFFGIIHPKTQTPLLGTLASGVFAGVMAAIFNVDQLIDMMSIGTLLAYSVVAICVLVLRFQDPNPVMYEQPSVERAIGGAGAQGYSPGLSLLKDSFNLSLQKYPSRTSQTVAYWALTTYMILSAVICVTLVVLEDSLGKGSVWAISTVVIQVIALAISFLALNRQPQSHTNLTFNVPLVPLIPCASIIINFYLMAKLDVNTWIRFSVWLFIGMLIYIFYSIPNSVVGLRANSERNRPSEKSIKETTRI